MSATSHTQAIEDPKPPGSRVRMLAAARYCCQRQDLLTLPNRNGAHMPACELRFCPDNEVLVLMRLHLNDVNYADFCTRTWGTELTQSMRLLERPDRVGPK